MNRLYRIVRAHLPSLAIFVVAILLIFMPTWYQTSWHNIINSIRFTIPTAPSYEVPGMENAEAIDKVHAYSYLVADGDEEIMLKLRQQGWPSYQQGKNICVGPFLDKAEQEANQKLIMQVTHKKVSVETYRTNTPCFP